MIVVTLVAFPSGVLNYRELRGHVDKVKFQFRGTYIGRSFLDDQFLAGITDANGNPVSSKDKRASVGAKFYSDLQGTFEAGDNFEFYVGVNNLFDTSPPPIISGLPNNVTGTETDAGTYDAVGRRYYTGVRLKF